MWGTILGFLGKFSIKQYLYGAAAILALTIILKGVGMYQAHAERVRNLETANQELNLQNQALEQEKADNQAAIAALEEEREKQAARLLQLSEDFNTIRDERETQKRVLEDNDRLGRLAAEKTSLIERKANEATQRLFEDFEEAINE